MSYETAPATKMLATCCVACGRPLVDAVSVNTGMGPDCRERHGFEQHADEATRKEVNRLVYALALWRGDNPGAPSLEEVVKHVAAIRTLGFAQLADVLEARLCTVTVEQVNEATLSVVAPYSPNFVDAVRRFARWNKAAKAWTFGVVHRKEVWRALRAAFPSTLGRGPRGLFTLSHI